VCLAGLLPANPVQPWQPVLAGSERTCSPLNKLLPEYNAKKGADNRLGLFSKVMTAAAVSSGLEECSLGPTAYLVLQSLT